MLDLVNLLKFIKEKKTVTIKLTNGDKFELRDGSVEDGGNSMLLVKTESSWYWIDVNNISYFYITSPEKKSNKS